MYYGSVMRFETHFYIYESFCYVVAGGIAFSFLSFCLISPTTCMVSCLYKCFALVSLTYLFNCFVYRSMKVITIKNKFLDTHALSDFCTNNTLTIEVIFVTSGGTS